MSCLENHDLTRRGLIGGAAATLSLWTSIPKAIAGTRDPRLLVVILRGALDGLSLAAPVGDPDYAALRGQFALAKPVAPANAGLALDDMFVLNPGMPYLHDLYRKKEATIVHAVATPYRERSHFDGQDVLESGLPGVKVGANEGWLNRALAGLNSTGHASPKGLAMGAVVPLVIRGRAEVLSWIPKTMNLPLRESTISRVMELYRHTDPKLAQAFDDGIKIQEISDPMDIVRTAAAAPQPKPAAPPPRPFRDFIDTAEAAARFMSAGDGPRVGALAYNGWDTHANEGAVGGQLFNRLSGLDAAIKAYAEGMGPVWKDTAVLIVTEFGRTARVNGTLGTDHGTGTVALLVGGAVKGGRVIADWPGVSEKALFENRDLKPTRDLRTVMKGLLRDHLGVPVTALSTTVFPDSAGMNPLDGLIA